MDKIKTVLDRNPIASETIRSKQDFEKVLAGYKMLKPTVWKSTWFYGTAGLATIAIVVAAVLYNPEDQTSVKNKVPVAQNEKMNVVDNIVLSTTSINNTQPTVNERFESSNVAPKMNVRPSNRVEKTIVPVAEKTDIPFTEDVQEIKPPAAAKKPNMLPNIAGYFDGEIPINEFCNQNGILVNDDLAVISFTIQYYNGRESIENTIKGNVIPFDVCENVAKTSLNGMVFITQIKAEHRVSGRITTLNSMNLTPTK